MAECGIAKIWVSGDKSKIRISLPLLLSTLDAPSLQLVTRSLIP